MKVRLPVMPCFLLRRRSEAISPFLGKWTVTEFTCIGKSSEWCQDGNRPASLEMHNLPGGLLARYRATSGFEVCCFYAVEANKGNELVLVGCPPPYKSRALYFTAAQGKVPQRPPGGLGPDGQAGIQMVCGSLGTRPNNSFEPKPLRNSAQFRRQPPWKDVPAGMCC